MLLWIRNLNFRGGIAEISAFGRLFTVPEGVVQLTVDAGQVTVIVPEGIVTAGEPQ